MAKSGNKSLGEAKRQKKDEFYTQLGDINAELRHYSAHFRDKVVFCNCDDPYESNFFKYFAANFNALGIRRLIATCYAGSPVAGRQLELDFGDGFNAEAQRRRDGGDDGVRGAPALPNFGDGFNAEAQRRRDGGDDGVRGAPALPNVGRARSPSAPNAFLRIPHKIVINEVTDVNGDGRIDLADVEWLIKNDKNVLSRLEGDGDFRSAECVALLKEADIVVTNPPFSLFREYVAQLIQYSKKFLIVGNMNEAHYKEIFSLIKDNKMWLGYGNGDMAFQVPESYEARETRFWVDETGQKWRSLGNACWFTNLDIKKRHEEYVFIRRYNAADYPRYANYDAIDVGKISDIPEDWDGLMGVPDTFLERYNPDQFEIVGLGAGDLAKEIGVGKNFRGRTDVALKIDGKDKCPYSRIIIRRRK